MEIFKYIDIFFKYLHVAEDLIHHWLAGVESASMSQTTSHGTGGEGRGAIKTATGVYSKENMSAEAEDFLSTVDWVSGDVGQSTKDVLRGLLSKELKCEVSHRQPVAKRKHDPRVAIEMRHKQVRLGSNPNPNSLRRIIIATPPVLPMTLHVHV